ncbi:MAG: MCE family protein [Propionibacteriales bacterium]|nr:MCE family protein [Propionibacteriales bacterium]
MTLFDKETTSASVKLVIFIVVTVLATGMLVVTIGNITFGEKRDYQAVFSDVTGLNNGDDIRIAGVRVGTVEGIEIRGTRQALVSFSVEADQRLDRSITATIRYRNLVGQRYISLTPGSGPSGVLKEDSTIPLDQTKPALDLTVLFNGFKPLFAALSPDDVNKLSFEIIQVFQGEGGTVESLLAHTASVTNTLADRDQVVGELITNLNDVLDSLGKRDSQLTSLIIELQQFVTGLSDDREAILGSLDSVSALADETAGLASDVRPALVEDIKQLKRVAGNLDKGKKQIDDSLQILPIKLEKIGRTATYGSFFNFYVCNFHGGVILPSLTEGGKPTRVPVDYSTNSARCSL